MLRIHRFHNIRPQFHVELMARALTIRIGKFGWIIML